MKNDQSQIQIGDLVHWFLNPNQLGVIVGIEVKQFNVRYYVRWFDSFDEEVSMVRFDFVKVSE